MDCHRKIDAHITTLKIDLNNMDTERIKIENKKIMKIIQNMEFAGEEQSFFNDKLNTKSGDL